MFIFWSMVSSSSPCQLMFPTKDVNPCTFLLLSSKVQAWAIGEECDGLLPKLSHHNQCVCLHTHTHIYIYRCTLMWKIMFPEWMSHGCDDSILWSRFKGKSWNSAYILEACEQWDRTQPSHSSLFMPRLFLPSLVFRRILYKSFAF